MITLELHNITISAVESEMDIDLAKGFVAVWPWPATKHHAAALLPLPPREWGGEWKGKGK